MPSPAELKTVGDDSCSTLEEEQQMIMQNNKKIIIIIISIVFNDVKDPASTLGHRPKLIPHTW